MNNICPSTVPCGMPEVTGLVCDDFPSRLYYSLILVIEKWSSPPKGTAIDADYLELQQETLSCDFIKCLSKI